MWIFLSKVYFMTHIMLCFVVQVPITSYNFLTSHTAARSSMAITTQHCLPDFDSVLADFTY